LLRNNEIDLSVIRSILEARLHNGPKVAELAARRHAPDLVSRLGESIRELENDADPVGQQRHVLAFWDLVVDGADSIVFRLMFNTLRAAYEPALPALATMMAAEVGQIDCDRDLAAAIEAADPIAAEAAARALLEPATHALTVALTAMEESR
jgi:DNA-binding FadR family transcriptional regulator